MVPKNEAPMSKAEQSQAVRVKDQRQHGGDTQLLSMVQAGLPDELCSLPKGLLKEGWW